MREFDQLIEDIGKSRKITRTERYPKGFVFSRDFLEMLESEYGRMFAEAGNRNFHSNFLKALSFELDRFQNDPEILSGYIQEMPKVEPETFEIPDDIPSLP